MADGKCGLACTMPDAAALARTAVASRFAALARTLRVPAGEAADGAHG